MKDDVKGQITNQICDNPKLGFLDRFFNIMVFFSMVQWHQ